MWLVNGERKQFQASRFSGIRCFLFAIEKPKVRALTIYADLGLPSLMGLAPVDTSISRRCAHATTRVLHVSTVRRHAQIRPPAVQFVPVSMVSFQAITARQSKQLTVQVDVSDLAPDVFTTRRVPLIQRPSPLVDPVGISSINDGVGSNAAISGAERDTHGILGEHRVPPVPVAASPAVTSSAGTSCVNYTSLSLVGGG